MKYFFSFQSKFDLTLNRKQWVLSEVDKCLRIFKYSLYAEYFNKYSTLAELKANPYSRTDPNQLGKLVEKWYLTQWQV